MPQVIIYALHHDACNGSHFVRVASGSWRYCLLALQARHALCRNGGCLYVSRKGGPKRPLMDTN